jgi:hypothetical protein
MHAVHGNSSEPVNYGLIKVNKEREITNYITDGENGIHLAGRTGPNIRINYPYDKLKSTELPGELR